MSHARCAGFGGLSIAPQAGSGIDPMFFRYFCAKLSELPGEIAELSSFFLADWCVLYKVTKRHRTSRDPPTKKGRYAHEETVMRRPRHRHDADGMPRHGRDRGRSHRSGADHDQRRAVRQGH